MNVSGSGASALSGLSDVAISSPSTGQVPVYNSVSGKWENGAVSATDSFAGVILGLTANQSIAASGSPTDILFDLEIRGETSHFSHSTSSNKEQVTVNTAGLVKVSGNLGLDSTSGAGGWSYGYLYIKKNGTTVDKKRIQTYASSIPYATSDSTISFIVDCSPGDVLKLSLNDSINALDIVGRSASIDQTQITFQHLGT